uniref:Coiled-coil domain-containing protein n=1 Tax=Ornithodoros turicata TaxID=34597 RepID=A0A2R5LDX3_9ACAR
MELTKKLKSLVGRQGSLSNTSSAENCSVSPSSPQASVDRVKPCEQRPSLADPQLEEETLNSIEPVYYSDDTFDASEYVLKKLPEDFDKAVIQAERQTLRNQLYVVSKRVSDLILQNQSCYMSELQTVMELQRNLEEAGEICSTGRRNLAKTREDFTEASLGILANCRKRETLRSLLKSLHLIKTLQETDASLRELLEEENYAGAIQLCLACQNAASTLKHYRCISELSSKLQDTLEMTDEQLDVALSKICTKFDKCKYEKLQAAYELLGKTQIAADQLLMHFASAIHNRASAIVLGYVELCSGQKDANFQKMLYPALCANIHVDCFTSCLMDLSKALWEVMCSYKAILEWHGSREVPPPTPSEEGDAPDVAYLYVQQKLQHGLLRIWQDVQNKVQLYVLACDISSFKFDEFIQVLDIVRRLMNIGDEFCQSKSEDLQESLRKLSGNYFKNYHRCCLDELRMFLENESWALVPVRENFSILHLQEFRFLRNSLQARPVLSPDRVEKAEEISPMRRSGTRTFDINSNPFVIQADDEEEDVFDSASNDHNKGAGSDSDDSDVPEELKQDYVDEMAGETPQRRTSKPSKRYMSRPENVPFVTNTTLNVLRLLGKYMKMMDVLHIIAFDVFLCMSQLFDYYMYTVYLFFAKEMSDFSENSLSNKLRTSLRRISDVLILVSKDLESGDPSQTKDKVPPPSLSPVVSLIDPADLHGLAERVVAAESLAFLSQQFESLAPHLDALIPQAKQPYLKTYTQNVALSVDLRRPIYMTVAAKSINYDQVLGFMERVHWDIHDIPSQHSSYVDLLVRELQNFIMRLSDVSKRTPIPKVASSLLWEHCIRMSNRTFIEGFSQAKKCTNEGRALMQLDYQQFVSKVEKLMDLRPLPDRELVEGYIKAYYMLDKALESWILSHKEYTPKQLIGLVNCVTQLNKKSRQNLINLIDENDRTKR